MKTALKKVLVTGAAGFIGSRICELLTGTDTAVVAIDNFDPYYDVSLKRYRWDKLQPLNHVQRQELDITDVTALEALFEAHSFDAVVNMAAMAGVRFSIENPAKYFKVNAQGFVGLLETMRKHGVTQVVQASTSSLYAGLPMPFLETLDVRTPISPYAASKLGAEALGYTYSHLHGFDVTVLRHFTVYGPAGRPDMAPFRLLNGACEERKSNSSATASNLETSHTSMISRSAPLPPFKSAFPVLKSSTLVAEENARPSLR